MYCAFSSITSFCGLNKVCIESYNNIYYTFSVLFFFQTPNNTSNSSIALSFLKWTFACLVQGWIVLDCFLELNVTCETPVSCLSRGTALRSAFCLVCNHHNCVKSSVLQCCRTIKHENHLVPNTFYRHCNKLLFRISMGMETSQSYYNSLCVEKQELTRFCPSWLLSSYHSGRWGSFPPQQTCVLFVGELGLAGQWEMGILFEN